MKQAKSVILGAAILAGSYTHSAASESVDEQIAAIQQASSAERVELMNRFKKNIAEMNEADRLKAIEQMRERLNIRTKGHIAKNSDAALKSQQAGQAVQFQQMNQMRQSNMVQMQNRNMRGGGEGGKR